MSNNTRTEVLATIREAIRDELTTLRCIRGELSAPGLTAPERTMLKGERSRAVARLQRNLTLLTAYRPTVRTPREQHRAHQGGSK